MRTFDSVDIKKARSNGNEEKAREEWGRFSEPEQ